MGVFLSIDKHYIAPVTCAEIFFRLTSSDNTGDSPQTFYE